MMQESVRKVAAVFFLLLVFLCSACAGDKPEPRLITVTGEAEVRVAPDEAILTLGVETLDKDLGIAKRHNDERLRSIVALAKKSNGAPGTVRIENLTVEPRYKGEGVQEELTGYCVRTTVVLIVRDVSKFDDLLTSILEAGATYVYGVQFRTTKLRQYRDQARALALKAAKEKAKMMAKGLRRKAGRPYAIVEEPYERGMAPNVIQGTGGSSGEADKSIAVGQISVSARVRVSFELR